MSALFTCISLGRRTLRPLLPRRGVALLKALWANYSFRAFTPRVVAHSYGRYTFQLQLIDFDGASWYDADSKESDFAEMDLLRTHKLAPGAKVFNAGANQGLQAMMMAREVGRSGSVVAIEPNRHNVRAARKNSELNEITNLRVIEAAVSSQPGQLRFNGSMNDQVADAGQAGAYTVEAITLDTLATEAGPPDVLYIDVEGFECEVLEGSRNILNTQRPDCFVEVHLGMGLERFGGSVQKLLSFFPPNEYDIYYKLPTDVAFQLATVTTAFPQQRFFLAAVARQ